MNSADLRKKSARELEELLKKERAHIAAFQFHSAKGRSKNVKEKMTSRRTIARILTILREHHGKN